MTGDHASGYEVELGHPLAGASPDGTFEDPEFELTFVGGIPVTDEPVPYFVARGSDREALDDLLDDHASIERFEPISDGPEGRHYRCEWATRDGDILSAIRECDGIASRLGITEQALSQRLRRALRNLVGSTIDDLDRGSRSE